MIHWVLRMILLRQSYVLILSYKLIVIPFLRTFVKVFVRRPWWFVFGCHQNVLVRFAVWDVIVNFNNAFTPVNGVNVIFYLFLILRLLLVKYFPQFNVVNAITTALSVIFTFYNLLELVQKSTSSAWCVRLNKQKRLEKIENVFYLLDYNFWNCSRNFLL